MRIALPISVALNLLLITSIVMARVDLSRNRVDEVPFTSVASATDFPVWQAEPRSSRDLHAQLTASGFAEESIKPLMLGWVLAQAAMQQPAGAAAYWRADYQPAKQDLIHRIDVEQHARQELLGLYGPAAVSEPAFAVLFRPLGQSFEFLSSEQQLLLQRAQIDSVDAGSRPPLDACGRETRAVPRAGQAGNAQDDLLAALDDSARREYLLRFSPLAQRLRDSSVAANETEFRQAFEIAGQLEDAVSPGRLIEIRRRLRSALGDRNFDRFWAGQDPFYAELERHLRAEGHSEQDIALAYGVINASQDKLLQALDGGSTQSHLAEVAAAERSRERSRLTGILGEQSADRLLAKRSELALHVGAGNTAANTACFGSN